MSARAAAQQAEFFDTIETACQLPLRRDAGAAALGGSGRRMGRNPRPRDQASDRFHE
jgi:hypothetical protein